MPAKKSFLKSKLLPALILIAAAAIWLFENLSPQTPASPRKAQISPPSQESTPAASTGSYETYRNCTLVAGRGNDGDSFRVKLPDGREEIFRLYFVDAPESAFKTYGGGRNNHKRISQQAEALGSITPEQAVEIGKKAKSFVLDRLEKAPFTIHTAWDSPFNDRRYHAFVELSYRQQTRFLHEILVEKGYARVHTKGAELPDGTSERKQENHLKTLEKIARGEKAGAWAF